MYPSGKDDLSNMLNFLLRGESDVAMEGTIFIWVDNRMNSTEAV
ncbi:hypothetical protein [Paenibacillus polymyxa]|uniref:Uncharacterized protein n=1 Tax=Paenibacillus polymyxa TaxID=1406 RepID=A0AAP4E9Q2_PAEPO|nr:hypothetical protein [Paenibacillus polymyxa]MDH2330723.1 hypothetical protein [Paenibacillus polymyxa]